MSYSWLLFIIQLAKYTPDDIVYIITAIENPWFDELLSNNVRCLLIFMSIQMQNTNFSWSYSFVVE